MENKNSSVDEFFEKLPVEDKQDANIFDEIPREDGSQASPNEVKDDDKGDDPEAAPESVKDRRHRRLEQRLQAERESNIALNARLQTLSEMDKFAKDNSDVDPDIAKIFDSSDAGKENALRFSAVLKRVKDEAKEQAISEIEERDAAAKAEQVKYESQIDNELEALEDSYNVDLTSDAPKARKARRELLEMVQELSPKGDDGTITGYADFDATFRQYQKSSQDTRQDNSRQKEIAARSMQRSGQSNGATTQITRGFDGWKTDYNLN